MANAKGARAYCALGASLVAVLMSSSIFAAIHGSGTEAIHGSGVDAIHGSGDLAKRDQLVVGRPDFELGKHTVDVEWSICRRRIGCLQMLEHRRMFGMDFVQDDRAGELACGNVERSQDVDRAHAAKKVLEHQCVGTGGIGRDALDRVKELRRRDSLRGRAI